MVTRRIRAPIGATAMARLRVLHVVRSMDLKTGGPAHAVRQISTNLVVQGMSVDIATTADSETIAEISDFDDGVRVLSFRRQIGRTWSFSLPLWRWLRENVGNYDVLHITGVFTFPAYIAARLALANNIPYVVRPAGTLDMFALRQKALKKKIFFLFFLRRVLQGAAAIHATSEAERQNLTFLDLGARCVVISLSVPLPPRRQSNDSTEKLNVLILARIHPIKAIPSLVQALHNLHNLGRDIHLTIAGDGLLDHVRVVKQLVEDLDMQALVDFPGFVGGDKKKELFRRADIFVLPSYQESFGIAVAEALAAGLPVIVSDQVALADEILNGGAGAVVPVNSPDQLAKRIDEFFDVKYREKIGRNARRLAESKFSAEDQGRFLRSLYEKVTTSAPIL